MSIYERKQLRSSDNEVFKEGLEERILRVKDTSELTAEGRAYVIRNPLSKHIFRFFVLNEDESIDYEIPQEDIISERSTYTETYQQGVRSNITLSLVNEGGKYTPNINGIWINTKIRFDVGISFQGKELWWKRGIYVLEDPFQTHLSAESTIDIQLADKFQRLIGKTGALETAYEIPTGSDIKEAIEGILRIKYGGLRSLDSKAIIYHSSFIGKKTPHVITKDANSTLGEMILDLAYMLNAECYYDSNGSLNLTPMSESIYSSKPMMWYFREDYDGKLEYNGQTIRYDFSNAVNEVHIIGDNINGEIFSAVAQNKSASSPLSAQLIGRRVLQINDSNISSDQQAEDRAQYELRNASVLGVDISLQVYLVPYLKVNSVIGADDSFLNWKRERLLVKSISFNISPNTVMNLSCANIDNLPFEG